MDGEQKGYAWLVACIAVVLVVLIGSITYTNVEENRAESRLIEKMVDKGISPAVLVCIDTTWETVASHGICREVLTNHNLSRQDAEKLVQGLK